MLRRNPVADFDAHAVYERIVQVAVLVVGHGDPQFGRRLPQEAERIGHLLRRTFVHGDIRPFEPPFFAEVSGEVGEERLPQRFEGRSARIGRHIDETARGTVPVVEFVVPRQHRVAVDGAVDSQTRHQFDPPVEDRVVVAPRSVCILCPDDHVGIGVEALVVPRVLVQRRGDDLLAGVGQQPHVRDKGLEVGVAPQVEPFDAGDGRRVLPEVEVVVPFGRGREFPADDRESDVECSELPPFCIHFYRRSVLSGGGVGRDGYRYPHRTDASGLYVENLDVVEHVRNQVRRVDRRIVIAAFVAELVAQDIADESGAGGVFGKRVPVRSERLHLDLYAFRTGGGPEQQLGGHPFAAPSLQPGGCRGRCVRGDRTSENGVRAHERGVEPSGNVRPVGERVGRGVGQFVER